jgi:tetratricopeptide (TPR) repeat protein
MLRDCRDLETSAPSRAALEGFEHAVTLMNGFFADPFAKIEAVLAEHPDFPLAHAFRANLLVSSSEAGAVPEIVASINAIAGSARATDRDRAHAAAAAAWAEGEFDLASERYDAIVQQWPRDLMALQFAHQLDFLTGDRDGLARTPAFVLNDWQGADLPGEGYVHGMLAFGLEENADYARAEEAGVRAVEHEPRDAWAIHAVAHVLEMQGRDQEGVQWLNRRSADWAPQNMLAYHNWWHLALYHLERNDTAAALDLYDRAIRTPGSAIAMEMVDASAMLWRLGLRGVDVGARWLELADSWASQPPGFYVFNDVHALKAFASAKRDGDVETWLDAMQRAGRGRGTNAVATQKVGLALGTGIVAFARGDHAAAVQLLEPLPAIARRMGGSNAQRDLINLTLLEAALRAGVRDTAGRLVRQRLEAKPESPFARMLAVRSAGLAQAA